jgi:hypothetical protein
MDSTTMIVSTACVAASSPVAMAALRGYRTFAGARFVTCPSTAEDAMVRIQATRAIASRLAGRGQIALKACSRWPENKGCAQACVSQIARSSDGCRARTRPASRAQQPSPWASDTFVGLQ